MKKKKKQLPSQVGAVSHAAEQAKTAVFLPDGKKRSFDIESEVELGMKVVPTGEGGVGLVVGEGKEGDDDKNKSLRPKTDDIFDQREYVFEWGTMFQFGDLFGHKSILQ